MTLWFTSDNHFGHKNILAYEQRPFISLEVMEEEMIERWNRVVRPHDTVWHLGDFSFHNQEKTIEIFNRLKGHKNIVLGNHDRKSNWMKKVGFEEIIKGWTYVQVGIYPMQLCHYPWQMDKRHEGKSYPDQAPDDGAGYLLHGHTHGPARRHGRQFHVGVDAWDYAPVSEGTVLRSIEVLS